MQAVGAEVDLDMVDILVKGGPVMVPLLLCSIIALAISLERLIYTARCRWDTRDLIERIKLLLGQDKPLEAMQAAKKARGPSAAVLSSGIANYDRDVETIREYMKAAGQQEIYRLERGLPMLDAIISIAPLLGLLGTITGIMKSFNILGALEGIAEPALLSVGIAEALITTAAGLIVAIPTVVLHYFISTRIERLVADMDVRATEFIDFIKVINGKSS